MRRAAPLTLIFVIVFLVAPVAFVSPVAASPQPSPVCPICEHVLERNVITGEGENVEIERSTATVQLHANGSASWHVVNEPSPSTAARTNGSFNWEADDGRRASRRDPRKDVETRSPSDVAEHLLDATAPSEAVAVSARATEDEFVVDFRVPNASRRLGNVVLWKHVRRVGTWPRLGQTSLTVHPPDGWQVTNDPVGASANATHATWDGGDLRAGPYVAAMPADASAQRVKTGTAIAIDNASRLQGLLLPAALYATIATALLVVALTGLRVSGLVHETGGRPVLGALLSLLVTGALAIVLLFTVSISLLTIVVLFLADLGVVYLLVRNSRSAGKGALWRRFVRRIEDLGPRSDAHQIAAWTVASTALVAGWLAFESLLSYLGMHRGIGARVGLGLLLAPLAVAFPLGMALGRDDRTVGGRLLAMSGFWFAGFAGSLATYGPDLQHEGFEFLMPVMYVFVVTLLGLAIGSVGVVAGRTWIPADRDATGVDSTTDAREDHAGS